MPVTDEEFRAAVATSRSIREVCHRLGVSGSGGNYETVRRRIEKLQPDTRHFRYRRRPLRARTDEEVLSALEGAPSVRGVLERLGVSVTAAQRRALRERLESLGVDHEQLLAAVRREQASLVRPRKPLSHLLRPGSTTTTHVLRQRLLREAVFRPVCAMCGRTTWGSRPIPLELDHVNGDRRDNRLENLRLLCPNRHACTPTYRGRNIGRNRDALPAEVR